MQLYIPANEQELEKIETQVQVALASTLDYHLKRPEKLRELTCRIIGFPNGYQQLKSAMMGAAGIGEVSEPGEQKALGEFVTLVRTTTKDLLETREVHGCAPHDPEQFLVEIMDEMVYDWCGTGKHVSDGINNQGLEAQIEAVYEASGGFRVIVDALMGELPEIHPEHGEWPFSDYYH